MVEHIVSIKWTLGPGKYWTDACATVIEVFGLPGNRFYYTPLEDRMTFTFKSKKDAELCQILLSEFSY